MVSYCWYHDKRCHRQGACRLFAAKRLWPIFIRWQSKFSLLKRRARYRWLSAMSYCLWTWQWCISPRQPPNSRSLKSTPNRRKRCHTVSVLVLCLAHLLGITGFIIRTQLWTRGSQLYLIILRTVLSSCDLYYLELPSIMMISHTKGCPPSAWPYSPVGGNGRNWVHCSCTSTIQG